MTTARRRDSRDAAARPTAEDLQSEHRLDALDLGFSGEEFPEVRFDLDEFQTMLDARGVGCLYRKGIRCPCVRIETGQARAGCPDCGGLGFAYPLELEEPIIALCQNRSPRRTMDPSGQKVAGTMVCTFPVGVVPAEGDMILPDEEEHTVQQVLRRQVAQVDPRTVRGRETHPSQDAPVLTPTTERLLYPDVRRVEAIYWRDDAAGGGLKLAKEGRDYVRELNVITWHQGRGPAAGKAFSVRYRAPAAYVLSPAEPVTRTSEPGFPYRAEAKRLDRWGTPDLR